MDEEKKIGYVTDVDKNKLSETVKEKNLSDEIFEKFDQEIEDSFQKFLQELKSNLTGKEKPEDLQKRFNEWLEKNIAQLDELMEDNIAIQVVKDSELKLVGFSTVNEILNLEDEVEAEQKNKTKETVEVEIKGDQLKMTTFNNINPNAIAKLFNENNFKKEDELLNLLKTAKRKKDYSSDEVRKFQRIIVGIENPDSNAEDPKYKGNDSPLKRYGIDGKFGKETLEAFEQYVKKYPENTNSGTGAQGSEQTETGTQIIGGGTPKVGVGTPGIDQQETGEKKPETTTTETEATNRTMEFQKYLSDKITLDENLAKEIIEKGINKELTLQKLEKITEDGAKIIKDYEGTLIVPHLTELPKEILKTLWDGKNVIVEFQKGKLKKDKNGNRIIEMDGVDGETYNTLDKITQDVCNSLINKTVEEEPTKDKKNKKDKNRKRKNKGNKEEKNGDDKTEVVVPTSTNNNQNTDNQIITEGGPKGQSEEGPKEQSEEQREDPKIANFEKEIGERTSLDDKEKAKEIIETLGDVKNEINLPRLEKISKDAAEELKKYNGRLVVTALTELPLEVIQAFWDNSKTTIEFSNGKLSTKDNSRIIEINNTEETYNDLDKIDTKVCNLLIGKPAEETVEQPVVEAPAVKKPESSTTNVNGSSEVVVTDTNNNGNGSNEVVVTNTENTERIDGEGQHSSTNETIETENKEVLLQKAKQLKEVLKDADVEHKNAGIMLFLMCGKFDTFISDNSEQIAEKFNKYYKECINELKEKGLEDIVTILNNYKFGSNYYKYLLSWFITLTGGEEFYQKYNNLTTDKEKHNLLYEKIDEYNNTRGSIIEFVYTPDPVPTKEGNTDVKQPVTQVVKPVTVEQPEKVTEATEEGGKMSEEEINELFEHLKGATEGISEEEFSNLIQSLESIAPECITMLKDGKIQSLQKKYAGDTSTGIIPGEVVSRTAGLPQFGINGRLNRETYNLLMGIDDINDINSIKGTIRSDMFVDESFNLKNEIIKNDDKDNYIQVQGQKYYEAKDENISGLYYKKTDNSFELGYFENGQLNGRGIKSEYDGKLINGNTKDWNTDIPDDNKNNTNKNKNNNVEKPEPDPIEQFQQQINDWPTLNTDQANEIMENLGDKEIIRLDKLEEITVPVAKILKDYNKTLIVNGLKKLDPDVLKIFWNSGTTIEFKKGNLKTINGSRVITDKNDETLCSNFNDIDGKICESLISKDVEENGENNGHGNDSHTENNDNNNGQEELKKQTAKSSVQYKHSKTLEDSEYEKRHENAKNEKEAIKLLLGLKGFRDQTKDISIGLKGYKIRKLSEEWWDLATLKEALVGFQESKEENYTLIECFNSIARQYEQGIRNFKFEEMNKKLENGKYIQPKDPTTIRPSFGKLGTAYLTYKEGTGGAYFNAVMGLLERYFVQGGISIEDLREGETLFEKIFNENNYGTVKDKLNLDKKKTDFDDAEGSNDKVRYNVKGEKEFIEILSDFNPDGRLDDNDRGNSTMGLELQNIYKSTNIDFRNSDLSDQIESDQFVWKNIVNFAIDYFKAMGDNDTASKLEGVTTIEELNTKLKEKTDGEYTTLTSLQTMLKDSPVPISFICKYGNKAQEMFFNELMGDEEFDKMYDEAFDKLIEEGVDRKLKTGLKPAIYASYINGGIGGGFGMAYDNKKIGSLSMSLGATHVPGSEDLQYGIVLGRDPKFLEANIGSGKIKGGINVGYGTYGFLALGNINFVSGIANKKELKAMKADSVKRINIGLTGGRLGDGIYASLKLGQSDDYMEGARQLHNNLNNYLNESLTKIFDDEKFKTFFTNGQLDTSKGEEIKNFLEEKLGETGEGKEKKVIETAAENIYNGLMYFSAGLKFDKNDEKAFNIAKNRMIYQLSETYTNKYMSEHINEKLDGKLKLTDAAIGPAIFFNGNWAESIAKSIYYSVVGNIGFTKYGNTYMKETDASMNSHETRLATGLGMDYLEGSVDKEGYITEEAINYLNQKLSIVGTKLGKLERNVDEKYILIPKDLCKSVNIRLNPSIKDYISSTEKGFKIPLNAEIALLTHSGTNSTQFELVIGDNKTDSQERLYSSLELKGDKDTSEYVPQKEGKKKFDIAKINESISEFTTRNKDFPLTRCEFTTTGKFAFIQKEGETITIDDKLSIDDKNRIVLPSYGKLTIKKDEEGKYKASFENGNEKKLTIVYDDGTTKKLLGDGIKIEKVFENENNNELNKIFDGIEDKLSKMDDSEKNSGRYATFMNAAATLGLDKILDENDIDSAFGELRNLIYDQLNEDVFEALKQKFDDPNISTEEKAMIIDRFKAIFSYNNGITNPDGLKTQLDRRGSRDTYKKLHGYDETIKFPLTSKDYRKAIVDQLNKMESFGRELNPNLIGMTAFYRLGQNEKGRSYMMTELGGTNVLGGVTEPISDEKDIKETKNWFTKNLEKSGVHKEILRKALSEKIKSILKLKELELKEEDIKEILLGNSIDIGEKKYKIDTKYVFYLLGECANESIGVEIGNIKLDDPNGGGGGEGGNGGDTLIIEPEETSEGKYGVYVGSTEARNKTVIQEVSKFGGGVAAGIGGDEEELDDNSNTNFDVGGDQPSNSDNSSTTFTGGGALGHGPGGSTNGNGGGLFQPNNGSNGYGDGGDNSGDGGGFFPVNPE